jgi:hypothetical protein
MPTEQKDSIAMTGDLTMSGTAGIITANFMWDANSVDRCFFTAPRAMRVLGITARPQVAGNDASAVTAVVKKAASATAITAGTALHSGSIDLRGTAGTNQVLTLSTTSTDLDIASGTSIGVDFTGTLTAAVGHLTVYLQPK